MLKNRELYFSDPKHFNDPADCRIGIYDALNAAVNLAEKEDSTVKYKLQKLGALDSLFRQIENDVKRSAVFSLSREENNVLMWSHYADSHQGFSVGFSLSSEFTKYNKKMQLSELKKFTIRKIIPLSVISLNLLNVKSPLNGKNSGNL
jgi:hypothetical protein